MAAAALLRRTRAARRRAGATGRRRRRRPASAWRRRARRACRPRARAPPRPTTPSSTSGRSSARARCSWPARRAPRHGRNARGSGGPLAPASRAHASARIRCILSAPAWVQAPRPLAELASDAPARAGRAAAAAEAEERLAAECTFRPRLCAPAAGGGAPVRGARAAANRENAAPASPALLLHGQARTWLARAWPNRQGPLQKPRTARLTPSSARAHRCAPIPRVRIACMQEPPRKGACALPQTGADCLPTRAGAARAGGPDGGGAARAAGRAGGAARRAAGGRAGAVHVRAGGHALRARARPGAHSLSVRGARARLLLALPRFPPLACSMHACSCDQKRTRGANVPACAWRTLPAGVTLHVCSSSLHYEHGAYMRLPRRARPALRRGPGAERRGAARGRPPRPGAALGLLQRARRAQGPVLVRGLDRHLGLCDAARRLEAEQRAREERAFLLHPCGAPAPHTVPQPFALHTEARPAERPVSARPRSWLVVKWLPVPRLLDCVAPSSSTAAGQIRAILCPRERGWGHSLTVSRPDGGSRGAARHAGAARGRARRGRRGRCGRVHLPPGHQRGGQPAAAGADRGRAGRKQRNRR